MQYHSNYPIKNINGHYNLGQRYVEKEIITNAKFVVQLIDFIHIIYLKNLTIQD